MREDIPSRLIQSPLNPSDTAIFKCAGLVCALLSLAWSPTGHMVIGEIAKERLNRMRNAE